MGSINPVSTVISAVSDLAGIAKPVSKAYTGYNSTVGAYQQAQNVYNANQQNIAAQNTLQQQELQAQTEEDTRQRKLALNKSLATRQAAFGSQGIDTTDGSGAALMLGMVQNDADDKAFADQMDQLKRASIDQASNASSQKNLLQLQSNYNTARDGLITNIDNFI
jgi:hypothetical protein